MPLRDGATAPYIRIFFSPRSSVNQQIDVIGQKQILADSIGQIVVFEDSCIVVHDSWTMMHGSL